MKQRSASRVLCDPRIPLKLKENFYKTAISPDILCGTKCWVIKK